MKYLLMCSALAVLFSITISVSSASSRSSLYLGQIGAGDQLLSRSNVQKRAQPNAIQTKNVAYYGNLTTRITAVQAIQVGVSQRSSVQLLSGGIGQRNVTIRIKSARGAGFHYRVDIWGR